MKHIFSAIFITVAAICHAGGQNGPVNYTHTSGIVRATGVRDGSPAATKIIGPDGGVIIYGNGKITVSIPRDALEENASISIEPISSTLPYSQNAFRLLPEGLHFKKPVTITFRYNDSIVRSGSPEVLHIAYQDDRGIWKAIKAAQIDKLNKTISIQSLHFSDWAVFAQYQLLIDGSSSPDIIIIPNQQIVLNIAYTPLKPAGNNQDLEEEVLEPLVSKKTISGEADPVDEIEPLWQGSSKNWKVFGPGVLKETGSSMKCMYQGPSHTPPGNKPIFFSVDIVNLPGKEYKNAKIVLCAQVRVEDNYLEFELKGEKIKFHLAQAFINSEGISISGADFETNVPVINLVVGGTKEGNYPFGDLKNGMSEIGLMWKGNGYATEYYIKCGSTRPEKVYATGSIIIDAASSSNYLGIISGKFTGMVYIPTCDGSQDPTEIYGRFAVQVHMNGTRMIYTEKYDNHQKVMDNLIKVAKDLKLPKIPSKNIQKMPAAPKKGG